MANVGQLWIEMGADVARLRKDMGEASSIVKSFKSDAESAFQGVKAAAATYLSFQGLTQAFKATVDAAAEEEQSLLRLEAVLRAHGVTNREVTRIYNDMADELQLVTRYSDDQIRSAQELLTTMGVTPSKMREVIEASVQLGTRTGDLNSAAQALGQAFEGNYKQLKRLIPQLQDVKKGQLELDDVLRIVNQTFGDVAQKEMEGYAGQVNRLSKEWKEFGESVGGAVVPVLTKVLQLLNSIGTNGETGNQYTDYGANMMGMASFMPADVKKKNPMGEWDWDALGKNYQKIADQLTLESQKFIKPFIEVKEKAKDTSMTFEQLRDLWIKAEAEKYAAAEEFNEKYIADERKRQEAYLQEMTDLTIRNSEYDMRAKRDGMYESWRLKEEQIIELNRLETEYLEAQRDAMYQLFGELRSMAGSAGEYGEGPAKMLSSFQQILGAYSGEDEWSDRLNAAQNYYDALYAISEKSASDIQRLEEASLNLTEMKKSASFDRTARMVSGMFGALSGIAMSFYTASGKQNEFAFNAYKALAVAETIVATLSASQKAYDAGLKTTGSMAGGAAFAVIAAAVGAAKIAQILSTSPGTSSSASGLYGGGWGSSPSVPATTVTETITETQKGQNINIYVYGNVVDHQKFAREFVSELNQAEADGVH